MVLVPSSGGYGDPLDRPAEQVYEDVLDDYVSAETALRDYGVIIENRELDLKATIETRKKMREGRGKVELYTE